MSTKENIVNFFDIVIHIYGTSWALRTFYIWNNDKWVGCFEITLAFLFILILLIKAYIFKKHFDRVMELNDSLTKLIRDQSIKLEQNQEEIIRLGNETSRLSELSIDLYTELEDTYSI